MHQVDIDLPWDCNAKISDIDSLMRFNDEVQEADLFASSTPLDLSLEYIPEDINQEVIKPQKDMQIQQSYDAIKEEEIDSLKQASSSSNASSFATSLALASLPLALKYRPKCFDELVGQESVSKTLSLALKQNKISFAYLFSGLRGSGKTSSARILARCLQCFEGISSTPCNICPSCVASLNGSNIDIIELDGASNRKIDDIRDLIEQTHYKPSFSRFKIFIIDEVHMLTKEAFNALLKTLEEPPEYVKFILATTDPLKVPQTILSRAQHFRFKKISKDALSAHLEAILQKEGVLYEKDGINMLIRYGQGSARDTLTLLDQAIIYCQNNITAKALSSMLGALDPSNFEMFFKALLNKDRQGVLDFVSKSLSFSEGFLEQMELYIKDRMLEDSFLVPFNLGMRYCNILKEARQMQYMDADPEFYILLTCLKMLEAQKIKDIDDAIKEAELDNKLGLQKPLKEIAIKEAIKEIKKEDINPNAFKDSIKQEESSHTKYEILLEKILQKDYEIGMIFKDKISMQEYKDNTLVLLTSTKEEENALIRVAFKAILELTKEVFSKDAKIKVIKQEEASINLQANTKQSFVEENREIFKSLDENLGIKNLEVYKR